MITANPLLEQFEKELDEHPDDWNLRLIAADAYLDAGDELRSAFLRWSAEVRIHPYCDGEPKNEYWWFDQDSSRGHISSLPHPLRYVDVGNFWIDRGKEWYDRGSRLGAETDLAIYLRDQGVI